MPSFQEMDDSTGIAITRVTNIIRVLASHFIPLTDALLVEGYDWAVEHHEQAKDLLQEDVGDALVSVISARG